MTRQMLSGEQQLATFSNLTLTNERIWQIVSVSGSDGLTSAPLHCVDWVSAGRQQHKWLLTIAGVFAALSLLMKAAMSGDAGWIAFLALLVMAGAAAYMFFATRTLTLAIGAGSMRISVIVKGGDAALSRGLAFLDAVEAAAATKRTPAAQGRLAA